MGYCLYSGDARQGRPMGMCAHGQIQIQQHIQVQTFNDGMTPRRDPCSIEGAYPLVVF
jgi:hypothetical protein